MAQVSLVDKRYANREYHQGTEHKQSSTYRQNTQMWSGAIQFHFSLHFCLKLTTNFKQKQKEAK